MADVDVNRLLERLAQVIGRMVIDREIAAMSRETPPPPPPPTDG
jgi:hypothetical protein